MHKPYNRSPNEDVNTKLIINKSWFSDKCALCLIHSFSPALDIKIRPNLQLPRGTKFLLLIYLLHYLEPTYQYSLLTTKSAALRNEVLVFF